MARIPTYERRVDGAAGAAINLPRANAGDFGAGLGQSVERAGFLMMDRDAANAAAERKANKNAAMAEVAKKLAQGEAAILTGQREARAAAAVDGEGYLDAAMARFEQVKSAVLDGITDPDARAWAEQRLIPMGAKVEVDEGGYAAGLRSAKVVGDFSAGRDIAANNLFTDPTPARLGDTLAAQGALVNLLNAPPDVREKIRAETSERLTLSYAQGLAERDPYALREQIDAGALNAMLPPEKLGTLRNKADTEIRGREAAAKAERREARAEAARAARDRKDAQRDYKTTVRDTARDYIDMMKAGIPPEPGELAALAGATARIPGGGALARQIGVMSEQAAVQTGLRGATPRQVQDVVVQLRGKAESADGPQRQVFLARLEAAEAKLGGMSAALASDKLGFGQREGVTDLAPLDVADADSVKARLAAAGAVKARYGGPLEVLTSTEKDELMTRLDKGTQEQKQQLLAGLSRLGPLGAAAALRQISPGQPVLAHAGLLMGRPGSTFVARQMITGLEAIKANNKLVAEDDVIAAVPEVTGRALRHMAQMSGTLTEGARAFGAGFAASNGLTKLSSRQLNSSINSVAGQTRGSDGVLRGGFGERNGVTVLLPDTKSEEEFGKLHDLLTIKNLPPARKPVYMKPGGVPGRELTDEELRAAIPFAIGNGRYVLTVDDEGDQIIMRRDGTPFEVMVK